MGHSKRERQSRILSLIKEHAISTQEELTRFLRREGYDTTQATVSRDINELSIVKTVLADGNSKYISMAKDSDLVSKRILGVFARAVTDIRAAQNILVVITLPGMAQASAFAIDAMHLPEVRGCLAGDDTIFVATNGLEDCERLRDQLLPLCHKDEDSEE